MKNLILKIIGGISLGLGMLGAFLPLLPSTYFVLLASWAFSQSSPKFHDWLYNSSPFSSSIQNWQQHRAIPVKAKVIITLSLVSSYVISTMLVSNTIVLISLGLGMTALLSYLLTRPSEGGYQLSSYTAANNVRQ